jgi:peptide chain release factor 2
LTLWRRLESRSQSTLELLELAQEESDQSLLAEVAREAGELEADYATARRDLLFGGEYDARNGLLTISAGAGGTEATDWAQMLLRMYLRWAERHRFGTEILDQTEGEETGIKSVTVAVDGRAEATPHDFRPG